MSVTEQGSQVVWDLESQDPVTFGQTDRLVVDQAVISRLVFSVDYVWISDLPGHLLPPRGYRR